jgi:hypothetical protein
VPQWDLGRESLFMAYYFRSGSLHSYGSPALYRYPNLPVVFVLCPLSLSFFVRRLTTIGVRREAIEGARYEVGDVISIQLGTKSARESQDLPSEWKRCASNSLFNERGLSMSDSCETCDALAQPATIN